jgi:hypothetical protein
MNNVEELNNRGDEYIAAQQAAVESANRELNSRKSWQRVIVFDDTLLPVDSFDLELLPESLHGWVEDCAYRLDNSPVDYIAAGVMVALGALVGKRIGIHPKRNDDWLVLPNLWGAIIAPPSKRKTPQLQEALRFLNAIDADAREIHQSEMEAFATTRQYNEMVMAAAKEQAKKEIKKGNHKGAKQHMEDTADEIEPAPVRQRYIFNDSTIEKLMEIQQENPMGLLLFRDELSGWMASLDREDRRSDRAYVLEGWPGNQSSSYDRVGRGSGHVNSNTLSVLGGIQPGKV